MIQVSKLHFIGLKGKEIIPIICDHCGENFTRSKFQVKDCKRPSLGNDILNWDWNNTPDFCSRQCIYGSQKSGKLTNCKLCDVGIYIRNAMIKLDKNRFCSQTCSAIYNNKHKTHGTRRSKLEVWLEEQLVLKYPDLEIHFNRRDTINSELDFYIPSLKLAFELNGIFHYEPIYGADKLLRTQNNDNRKFQACIERGIELCIIDSSSQKYFKKETSQKYLDIITNVLESKQRRSGGI